MDSTKYKLCKGCNRTLELVTDNFFKNGRYPTGGQKWDALCKNCEMGRKIERFNNIVKEVFPKLECSVCTYSKCIAALDFHHIFPEDKITNVSRMRCTEVAKDKLIAELNKCIILCANCHREYHAGIIDIIDYI